MRTRAVDTIELAVISRAAVHFSPPPPVTLFRRGFFRSLIERLSEIFPATRFAMHRCGGIPRGAFYRSEASLRSILESEKKKEDIPSASVSAAYS